MGLWVVLRVWRLLGDLLHSEAEVSCAEVLGVAGQLKDIRYPPGWVETGSCSRMGSTSEAARLPRLSRTPGLAMDGGA